MLDKLLNSIQNNRENNALWINGRYYTYHELEKKVSGISDALKKLSLAPQSSVGLITSNSLDTYASILALWFNELIFVPLSPAIPLNRNLEIISQTNISHVLYDDSEVDNSTFGQNVKMLFTPSFPEGSSVKNNNQNPENILYILFTSGSTGTPKGVPISQKNLTAYTHAFLSMDYSLSSSDRFLQIFDFTFDVSVKSYTIPLLLGACIYPVPQDGIKYMAALKILHDHSITFAHMVPSVLNLLKPYFSRISLKALRYSTFSGEALRENLMIEWQQCVPNARIENHYGPTEGTIDCFCHTWTSTNGKAYNGVVSIGKPFAGIHPIVVDEQMNPLPATAKGELLISGDQITRGYWNNHEKTNESFATINGTRYYKTGDLVFKDEDGNFYFCGRKDSQIKIQGYRVEPGEVEHQVRKIISNAVVVFPVEINDTVQLVLFIEKISEVDLIKVEETLKASLPHYMLPKKILTIDQIPLTISGKTDRKKLLELL